MWERISCAIFWGPRGSFSANFCPICFLQPEIQSAIDQSLPISAHQHKALGTNESMRSFCYFLDMFYQEALPKFWIVSCVDRLLAIGNRHWQNLSATFERRISKFTYVCTITGAFLMWGAYFCMGAYKHNVVVVIKMGAYIYRVLILCGCLLGRA